MLDPDRPVITRRRAVQAGGAAGAAVLLWRPASSAAAGEGTRALSRRAYAARAGDAFGIEGSTTALRLDAVTDLPQVASGAPAAGHPEAFALTFSAPSADGVPAGLVELEHPVLGRHPLSIGAIDRPADGRQRYEAVIDRTIRTSFGPVAADDPTATPSPAPAPVAPSGATAGQTAAATPSAAPGPAAATPAAGTPGAAATPSGAPAGFRITRALLVRRGRRVSVRVAATGAPGLRTVQIRVVRKGRTVARGSARLKAGAATVPLDRLRAMPAGSYEVFVAVRTRKGRTYGPIRRFVGLR